MQHLQNSREDRYSRVTAPAGFDDQATRRDYYFKTRNAAREYRLRIKAQDVSRIFVLYREGKGLDKATLFNWISAGRDIIGSSYRDALGTDC